MDLIIMSCSLIISLLLTHIFLEVGKVHVDLRIYFITLEQKNESWCT